MKFKIPQSVLVVIHNPLLEVLLIRRADVDGEYWQSVTGSRKAPDEPLALTAAREVQEETGLVADAPDCELRDWGLENEFDIYPHWRARYAPGVTRNVEHVFGLRVPRDASVHLNPREHSDYVWLPWRAAADRCFSPSNAEACLMLPRFVAGALP